MKFRLRSFPSIVVVYLYWVSKYVLINDNNRISGIFHLSGNKRNKFGGKEEDSSYFHLGTTLHYALKRMSQTLLSVFKTSISIINRPMNWQLGIEIHMCGINNYADLEIIPSKIFRNSNQKTSP